MDRWIGIARAAHVPKGDYDEDQLGTNSGIAAHVEGDFVAELATQLCWVIEHWPTSPTQTFALKPRAPASLYASYVRDGALTEAFYAVASETLAVWAEHTFHNPLHVHQNRPGGSEKGFDSVVVDRDAYGKPYLRVIQVKATKSRLQDNANEALNGFHSIEVRQNASFHYTLNEIDEKHQGRLGFSVADLVYAQGEGRSVRYRVFLMHGNVKPDLALLTTYDDKVLGPRERRSLRRFPIDWEEFWAVAWGHVDAQRHH